MFISHDRRSSIYNGFYFYGFYSQITNTVEELLYNEETYIRSLNYGINGYMKNFNRKGMPKVLRGQMYRIFGNVHRIKDFHENIFFPALKQCNMDIVKICNTFCDFIEVSAKHKSIYTTHTHAHVLFLFSASRHITPLYLMCTICIYTHLKSQVSIKISNDSFT